MLVWIDASEVHALADDLNNAGAYVEERAPLAVAKVGFDMLAAVEVYTPVRTGFLRSSESVDFDADGMGFDLGPTAEYGGAVELGVPHPVTIHAKPGGFLRFTVGGEVVYAKTVTIPPRGPQPYLGPGFDQEMPNLEQALGDLGENAIRGV